MKDFTQTNTNYWKAKVFFAYRKYFEKAAKMFCIRENYDAERFIKSSLMDGFKYPQQLCNEYIWKTYLNYMPAIHNSKDDEIEVVEEIVAAALEIKKNKSVKEWLNKKINQISVLSNRIKFSPLLLAFSSNFMDFCINNNCNYYDFPKMRERVLNLNISEKILNKIREVLNEDYYRYNEDNEELSKLLEDQGIVF